jgi:large subunit ribosomal protein L18
MEKLAKRNKRKSRIRGKISGTKSVPRLSVFRSNAHIYTQLIDDKVGITLVSANDIELKSEKKVSKLATAFQVGAELGNKALKKKIKKVVFDRAGYKYHGRVKAVAEGARKSGLVF